MSTHRTLIDEVRTYLVGVVAYHGEHLSMMNTGEVVATEAMKAYETAHIELAGKVIEFIDNGGWK